MFGEDGYIQYQCPWDMLNTKPTSKAPGDFGSMPSHFKDSFIKNLYENFTIQIPKDRANAIRLLPFQITNASTWITLLTDLDFQADRITLGIISLKEGKNPSQSQIRNSLLQASLNDSLGITDYWSGGSQTFTWNNTTQVKSLSWLDINAAQEQSLTMFYSYSLGTLSFYKNNLATGLIFSLGDSKGKSYIPFVALRLTGMSRRPWHSDHVMHFKQVRVESSLPALVQLCRNKVLTCLPKGYGKNRNGNLGIPQIMHKYIMLGAGVISSLNRFRSLDKIEDCVCSSCAKELLSTSDSCKCMWCRKWMRFLENRAKAGKIQFMW